MDQPRSFALDSPRIRLRKPAMRRIKRPRPAIPPTPRELDIVQRRANGETLQAVANSYGLTRQRIKQLADRVAKWNRTYGHLTGNEIPTNPEALSALTGTPSPCQPSSRAENGT